MLTLPTPMNWGVTELRLFVNAWATNSFSGLFPRNIRTMEELELPIEHLTPLTRYQNGLILITGSVGSGKSTTMASLVDFINKDREDHILTLEDPIEYVFQSQGCHVNQREVHSHTESFPKALRGALREDPDVIMVGEMRNLETISLALTAAETGHLVLATLHTGNAPRTLDRVLDVFPVDQRDQIRVMVSESLRGVSSHSSSFPRQTARDGPLPWNSSSTHPLLPQPFVTEKPSCSQASCRQVKMSA